jgi:diaminopimelate epimerase
VLADLDECVELSAAFVRALTDRRRGIGGDGVIRIVASPTAAVFMDYRNADGSIGEMCGNGVRVVAKYAVDRGLATPDADDAVTIGTRAGDKLVHIVERHADGSVAQVAVDMGPPGLDPASVPFRADEPDADPHRLSVDGEQLAVSVVSMGNPHAVLIVDDVAAAPVARLGPGVQRDERFPAGANVGFAEIVADDAIRLRVWERGVGETASCGTGACAAVVALQRRQLLADDVAVQLPGGTLHVRHQAGGTVTMTGPAVLVADGILDDRWVTAAGATPLGPSPRPVADPDARTHATADVPTHATAEAEPSR